MKMSKTLYQFISWLLIGFMLLANLVNLTTNGDLNNCVYKAYSATSLSEYYVSVADVPIKFITDFVLTITKGKLCKTENTAAATSSQNKKEKKQSSDKPFAVILSASNDKSINSVFNDFSPFSIISNSINTEISFDNNFLISFFFGIFLVLACFLRLARSDTEDNNIITYKNVLKFRLG